MLLNALCMIIIAGNIINIVYSIRLVNRMRNKEGKKEVPDCCPYESEQSSVNVVTVHKKESNCDSVTRLDNSISKINNKIERFSVDLNMIKKGRIFVVMVGGYPVTKVDIGLSGEVDYLAGINYSSSLFNKTYNPVIMTLSEAKNIAERLNGKVVFVEDYKSVVYDYTKEQ